MADMFSQPAGLVTKPSPARGRPDKPGNDGKKKCNCRNSKCLKLYCECFASGQYCFACNCQSCFNNPENDDKRKRAIDATLERNPQAFRPKIGTGGAEAVSTHTRGCHCKKSGCLKKYCECYQAGILCADTCKCVNCLNRPGSLLPGGARPFPSSRLPPKPKRLPETPEAHHGAASGLSTPLSASDYPMSHASAISAPSPLPAMEISTPLQLARAAVAQSINDDMISAVCRGALDSAASDAPAQQHEHHVPRPSGLGAGAASNGKRPMYERPVLPTANDARGEAMQALPPPKRPRLEVDSEGDASAANGARDPDGA